MAGTAAASTAAAPEIPDTPEEPVLSGHVTGAWPHTDQTITADIHLPEATPTYPLGGPTRHRSRRSAHPDGGRLRDPDRSEAASSLLSVSPEDGHAALWLAASDSLDKVINLDQFDQVGNQAAGNEVAVFATLPLESDHPHGSPEFSDDLRGLATELIHEFLRASGRRGYAQALHAPRISQ